MDGHKAERRFADGATRLSVSAAHEINNPLDSLLNLIYLAEAHTVAPEGRHYLALAKDEVLRIAKIAHDTLGEYQVSTAAQFTDVPELLNDMCDLYRPRFDSQHVRVKTRYCTDGHLPAYAGQLRQMFSNLLLNAADAMPTGGTVCVKASAWREWSGQQRHGVRVTVADNGSGIAQSDLPRVFERFFTTKAAGSGMGLSLVRDIVQKHDGVLRVRSSTTPGRSGTVFTVFLPAA